MIVGLPKGLYYYKYHKFIEKFLDNLHISYLTSPNTNKNILNEGIRTCVDEACLPIKIFHGHVSYLRDKCDLILTPRIMKASDGEYICPKFCGLPEMIINSIPELTTITSSPLYLNDKKKIYKWCEKVGKLAGKTPSLIKESFEDALKYHANEKQGLDDEKGFSLKIALLGHLYTVYDNHLNMDVINKLHALDAGVITEECVKMIHIKSAIENLVKKPFWSNMIGTLGSGVHLAQNNLVDGIVFLSSFQCGIDSVSIDIMKDMIEDFPMLVLKLDEHSGQAGMDTRLEAFIDMLKRRKLIDLDISTHG
ncbi:2-hydroxyglutaryl-CoA dehydratase [Alkalibaculum sp. M08DMB]|uniref:2-hydroxyglutaryl-CoA dehydratase n=1 Tax=Alkalibaculum sporogenes TaxID=2655001 RepID=A0A6A7K7N3_9FIRM|nr:2-hydroxyglutaryl-CoA dehydratase [Alkalibaculum sporogenes]